MQDARTERAEYFTDILGRLKGVASRIVDFSPIGSGKIVAESVIGKSFTGGSVGRSRMIHGIVGITGLSTYALAYLEARGTVPGAGMIGGLSLGTSYTLYFANMHGAVDKFRDAAAAAANIARKLGVLDAVPALEAVQMIAEHNPEEVAQALMSLEKADHDR